MAKKVTSSRKNKSTYHFAALRQKEKVLKQGASGDDVWALQGILTDMGYLRRDREPGVLCGCTRAALKYFQKCYKLSDSGEADEATMTLLEQPRCGVPDIGPNPETSSGPAPFVLRGCKYPNNHLTYAFRNSTPDLTESRQRAIVREAFAAWAAVTPLRFTEVGATDGPDFPIASERNSHGDGSSFDGAGRVLAHAFYPPPCGGPFSGALHFDEGESWSDNAAPGRIRLLNVAIHEIGHLLGLDHSDTRDAIMFAFYADDVDSLRPDDVEGIQALYGAGAAGPGSISGTLARSCQSQAHQLTVDRPGTLVATLVGPRDADFDLYVRRGQAPTRRNFDGRGFTSSSNEKVSVSVSGGSVFVLADSWRGSGSYTIDIEIV
jgi:peptidoglycan hydrolase-like protein with peptidoglycan-binding domain